LSFSILQSSHEGTFDSQMRTCLGTRRVCLTVKLITHVLGCAE
jgi:hypothetical protein